MAKGFGGFPGGNMQQLMRQAQKMQQDMQKIQQETQNMTMSASAGGSMVNVEVNGKYELVSLKIDKSVVNADDVEMLQDLIVAATNEAVRKMQAESEKKYSQVTGGISIPGLF
ncbi:MAG: YbaB/EbfC family nucleoid-associated protein [Bdellovibrionota bacterium]|nr:YbaB/EbfC family nucleoid-associated protein [Pseudomonadota bacterium]MDY6090538.1 YbaB/EbfC family nucleoid-associated protein [Bdellovibrionota bacterium]